MTWRPLLVGVVIAAAVWAGFWFYGTRFFTDARTPFLINSAAGAGIGFLLGLIAPFIAGARGGYERPRAAILIALPGLLACALAVTWFPVAFKPLNPAMARSFGALMIWSYAFFLFGGVLKWRE